MESTFVVAWKTKVEPRGDQGKTREDQRRPDDGTAHGQTDGETNEAEAEVILI